MAALQNSNMSDCFETIFSIPLCLFCVITSIEFPNSNRQFISITVSNPGWNYVYSVHETLKHVVIYLLLNHCLSAEITTTMTSTDWNYLILIINPAILIGWVAALTQMYSGKPQRYKYIFNRAKNWRKMYVRNTNFTK